MSKVIVESRVTGVVALEHPSIGSKLWERKGAKKQLELEALQEAMYDEGIRQIFDAGILYIEDMEQKKELDLEPFDATEPTNIVSLSDKEVESLLKTAPLAKFKETIDKLSSEQIKEVSRAAIALKITHLDKVGYLKKKSGIDILKAIEMAEAEAEAAE